MTPTQEKIATAMRPGREYTARDISNIIGVHSNSVHKHLVGMEQDKAVEFDTVHRIKVYRTTEARA